MANQTNIISDISTLIKVPNKTLLELVHKINLCIGNLIAEASARGESAVVLNIGIGTLSIDLIGMQCKFIPSRELKTTIKSSIASSIDPLELALEQALADKLSQFVDEVF